MSMFGFILIHYSFIIIVINFKAVLRQNPVESTGPRLAFLFTMNLVLKGTEGKIVWL